MGKKFLEIRMILLVKWKKSAEFTDDYSKSVFRRKSIPRVHLPENFDEFTPEQKATALQKMQKILSAREGCKRPYSA